MKKRLQYTAIFLLMGILSLGTSCSDFLGILPKGEKIPSTLEDYEAFIRNENTHVNDAVQALYLLNDVYIAPSVLNNVSLKSINYNWLEDEDRIRYNNSDEIAYYNSYQAIFYWNVMIEYLPDVTDGTEAERDELIAQAKVLRAMNYFFLTNYYADTYEKSTATKKLSVPLITSSDIGAPSEQVTIERMYEFIVTELKAALPYLPEKSATVLHPNKGAGYAMLARVYLTMENYEDALTNAELALEENDQLYNWREYYAENQTQIEKEDDYSTSYPAVGLHSPENYIFRYGTDGQRLFGYPGLDGTMPVTRAELFEEGDARFASMWKKKYEAPDTVYCGIRSDQFNGGGLSTPEMYYIKAECLARKGGQDNVNAAMEVVNTIRQTRILKKDYKPLMATSTIEAVKLIIQGKANEYVQTPIPFWDARRLNKDSNYAVIRTKEFEGKRSRFRRVPIYGPCRFRQEQLKTRAMAHYNKM